MPDPAMRILFVDDEPRVLDGIRRSLRRFREEWHMEFAPGGPEALAILDREPFDVVVADMRMPGMDGADLLAEVQRRHPSTVRLILSGYSESELVLKSIGPTHQYLSKPCDPEELERTVRRAVALRDVLDNAELRGLVARLGALPPLPEVYREVVAELQRPGASLARIGRIVASDVAMSAKILQVVNSAWFGLRSEVASVERAVAYLGLDALTSLILTADAFSRYEDVAVPGFRPTELWAHSVHTGACARVVAADLDLDRKAREDAYTAALLHDVGQLLFASMLPDAYGEVLAEVGRGVALETVERTRLGADHGAVGAYLCGLWGLPGTVVEGIAFHSRPADCPTRATEVTLAVHVADCIARQLAGRDDGERTAPDVAFLRERGVAGRWDDWKARCSDSTAASTGVAR